MTDIFLKVVNLSFSASWLVLAVIAARFLLKKAPKWVNVLLWGLVAVRLLCPFSLESALSLIPSSEVVSPQIMMDPTPTTQTGIDPVNTVVNDAISESFTPNPAASANPLQIWIPIWAVLWIVGIAAMAEYTLFTWLRLRRRVRLAVRVNGNVYLSENIDSPFVLGVFRPKIYIPYGMPQLDMYHVIAHERTHIRRRDHWWKPLGFFLLAVHWFNPLMWVAYILLCRDIELACDERVIKQMKPEQRANYSQALLNCSVRHRSIAACPVAFGEVGVKDRVKRVLTYRKPAFWIVAIAIILSVIVAVCFMTSPEGDLIEKIVNQDGYRLLFQTEHPVELHIYRRDYPADCYSLEGHTFQKNEHILGSHFGTTFYLKHMGYADEKGDYFRFTIGIDHQPEGNVVLTPYQVGTLDGKTTGTGSGLYIRTLFTENGSFDSEFCTPAWNGSLDEFEIRIRNGVWRNAVTGVWFTVEGFQKLFFEEDAPFSLITPRAITKSLTVENVDIAQATLWGDSTMHMELNPDQIGELVYILNQLPVDDFEPADHPYHYISLMMLCGDREILLKADGSHVWFTFDSETAANIDGDWMTRDEDLIRFLKGLSGYTQAERFYGVSLKVEEANANGATVVFTGTGEAPAGRLMGGNDYWVQVEKDGVWEDVVKAPEPSFTTNAYDIDNVRRHKIDWQWRYGTLSRGHYRIGKDVTYQEGAKPLETATVWAEFTLDSETVDAYAILSNLIPDGARAESTFASGGGYNCFPDEAESLVQILNSIEESELRISPEMSPIISLTLFANDDVTMHYNGTYVQFAFTGTPQETRWAVKHEKLNAFFEKINAYSPENSTYEIYNVAPLEDLPEHYSIEEAMIDKVVIQLEGDASYNQDVWQEFVDNATQHIPATVRVMKSYLSNGEAGSFKTIYELVYDGEDYTLSEVWDGITYTDRYKYLYFYHVDAGEDADYDGFDCYYLTNIHAASYEQLLNTDSHDAYNIYTDLIYLPKKPQLPNAEQIQLRINGLPLVTLAGYQQTEHLMELLNSAEYLGYEPKTYNLGPDLVLMGSDGTSLTLNLDLDSDLFRLDGLFYDYGPGYNSNGGINNLPVLLGMLGLENWPEEVRKAFPNYFLEIGDAAIPPANDLFSHTGNYIINVWYPDWAYLELGSGQANRLLKALEQEAPNPVDETIPDVPDTVFTVHIAFDGGQEYDLAYMGQTDFWLRDFKTNQVYRFSSEALRIAVDNAISETKVILNG